MSYNGDHITYDAAGNIQTVSKSGTVYYQYAYDELGQLIREDNKDANKSYTYTYDSRGNLLSKKTYAFTLGTLGTAQKTDSYGYATDSWKDRLTSYNGQTITYDAIGNPLTYNNGSAYTFTWEGRQMQTATKGNTTWTYTYNADGLRTGKSNGSAGYTYTWNENRQLQSMTWDYGCAVFSYDANGMPYSVKNYDAILDVERTYLYVTNLQGDVLSIIDASSGATAVTYTYDAWGKLISKSGTSSDYASIYEYNPLTYRGYIYDSETGFYYLQSRYYDPTIGRFLNADDTGFLGISGALLGWNLFAYCENNSVNNCDPTGCVTPANIIGALIGLILGAVGGYYLSRFLADKIGLKGWKRTLFIIGISAIISAAATVIGYFIGPYITKAFKTVLNGLRSIFKPKLGTQLGRWGTLIKNTKPVIKGLTKHGLQRMAQRGVSEALAQKIINTGHAVSQSGGKVLYFTNEGVVVLNAAMEVVTAYSSKYFDEAAQAIVSLFYK